MTVGASAPGPAIPRVAAVAGRGLGRGGSGPSPRRPCAPGSDPKLGATVQTC